MASIRREISIDASPDLIWAAARDVGALHTRLVPGFVADTRLEKDVRVVTFESGLVARERIIDVNDDDRRIVWSMIDGPLTHHNGALQVFARGDGSRVVWIADLLPDDLAKPVAASMEQGLTAMKRAMETQRANA
jgi:Polyketide cyclase / dehydrase and lipid transport